MPPFPIWIRSLIFVAIKEGDTIERDVVHMFMPPIDQTMWVFGNHICFSHVEKTLNNTWQWCNEQKYVLGPNNQKPFLVKLEYVKYVEKILKLNYRVLNIVVYCVIGWKKIKLENNAITNGNEYDFILVNFVSFIHISN